MDVLTVEEAAAKLKVEATTVRRMLKTGRLRGRKLGKAWRIPESELRRVVEVEAPGVSPPSATPLPRAPVDQTQFVSLMTELDALAGAWTGATPPLHADAVERIYREREDAQL